VKYFKLTYIDYADIYVYYVHGFNVWFLFIHLHSYSYS
jgi:hypothetical protein